MTPPPIQGGTSPSLAGRSASDARRVHAQLGVLLQDLGRPLSRTARLMRTKAGWLPGLRSLLISDLYGADTGTEGTGDTLQQRFLRLLAPLLAVWPEAANDPRVAGVAAQLSTIAALEPAVRGGDDSATGQALGAAISVELLLAELLQDLEASHLAALSR